MMNGAEIRGVLAKNIKSCREHRLWSQADLAAYSSISIPFLSEIERGNKWPFPDTLGKIAQALNIQVKELFQEKTSLTDKERDFATTLVKEMFIAQKAAAENVIRQHLGEIHDE